MRAGMGSKKTERYPAAIQVLRSGFYKAPISWLQKEKPDKPKDKPARSVPSRPVFVVAASPPQCNG